MRAFRLCLLAMSASAQAQPVPVVEPAARAAIARIEARDAKINAVIAIDPTAVEQARRLDDILPRSRFANTLGGMLVLVKDNIETAGPLPTTAGSLALARNVTGRDAPLVAGLRAHQAVILGKTNLSEWANGRSTHGISGWSAIGGVTRNPHALDRSACGSSSGSAAAVAAGYAEAAIGTETDGSITCPAAMTGIVGLKPTVGLVSRTHIVPISVSMDTAGPMARDVMTAARVLTAIAGSDPADPATAEADGRKRDYSAGLRRDALKGVRIGVLRFATGYHPATDATFERALAVLRAQGAILVDAGAAPDEDALGRAEGMILRTEFKAAINAYLATTPRAVAARTLTALIAFNRAHAREEMPLFAQERFEAAEKTKGLDDPAYRKALRDARRMAGPEGIDRLLAEARAVALIAPTTAPAFPIDPVNGDQLAGDGAGSIAAVAGYPHLTVPMGQVHGLPVGLSFIGAKWSEAALLSLGYAYEQAASTAKVPSLAETVSEDPALLKRAR